MAFRSLFLVAVGLAVGAAALPAYHAVTDAMTPPVVVIEKPNPGPVSLAGVREPDDVLRAVAKPPSGTPDPKQASIHMKAEQWDQAIEVLTTLISMRIGELVQKGSLRQFRAIYPEYALIDDDTLARKLHERFGSGKTYDIFLKQFDTMEIWSSRELAELYLQRSDANLAAGNWQIAAVEFRRAVNGFPVYGNGVPRWREARWGKQSPYFVDLRTFNNSRGETAKVWVRRGAKDGASAGSLERYELNCTTRQVRTVTLAGDSSGTQSESRWENVVPETFGEVVFEGVC